LVGVAFLSSVIARQVSAIVRQLEHAQKLIDELTVHDSETGLTKWRYASQTIRAEISRSRRYHTSLCLLFIRVANWDKLVEEHGPIGAEALMTETAATVADTLRTLVDTPTRFDSITLGAILPETSTEGARIAAQRLIDAVARKVRVALYVGIAHFPNDAVTDQDLVRAAKAALQFALTSGQSIVSYNQLSGAVEKDEAVEIHRPVPEITDSWPKTPLAIRLVVKGFREISTLSRFEETIRQLPRVVRVEPCRYAAGTLELIIELPAGAPALRADSIAGFDIRPVHSGNSYIEWELRDRG
jgi:diguanylate cyclase (GGDEF)-like protein